MPPLPTYTEAQLVALLRQQSREGFNYLYDNYAGVLFGVIRRIVKAEETAQDVLQESFVKIWNNIALYDESRGRIYTWMINIARNTAIDKLRSKGEVMSTKIRAGEEVVNSISESRKTEQATDTIGLKNLVAGLKQEYQVIVELAYFRGYTMEEVARTLNIPEGTVKTRRRKAIQLLRTQFNN